MIIYYILNYILYNSHPHHPRILKVRSFDKWIPFGPIWVFPAGGLPANLLTSTNSFTFKIFPTTCGLMGRYDFWWVWRRPGARTCSRKWAGRPIKPRRNFTLSKLELELSGILSLLIVSIVNWLYSTSLLVLLLWELVLPLSIIKEITFRVKGWQGYKDTNTCMKTSLHLYFIFIALYLNFIYVYAYLFWGIQREQCTWLELLHGSFPCSWTRRPTL